MKLTLYTVTILIVAMALLVMGFTQLKNSSVFTSAADFSLSSIDGKTVSLSDLRGKKAVVLSFFATWCPPCQAEFSHLEKINKWLNKNKAILIAIDLQEDQAQVKKFAAEKGATFLVLLDKDGSVARKYGVSGIPALFIIDKTGKIIFKMVGFNPDIESIIKEKLSTI